MSHAHPHQSRPAGGEVLGHKLLQLGRAVAADLVGGSVQRVTQSRPSKDMKNNLYFG